MLIDWFTVIAQIINFLILLWLLKRFLYQPILSAIDTREEQVANVLAEADEKHHLALLQYADYADKNEQFDQVNEQMLLDAQAAVANHRAILMSEAQDAAKEIKEQHRARLAKEADDFKYMLRQTTLDEVFAISRQALQSLASKSLEQQITDVFVEQIKSLDSHSKSELISALQAPSNSENSNSGSHDSVSLRSAFELSNTQYQVIQSTLEDITGKPIELLYTGTNNNSDELIAGIEITANGYRLAWSIEQYLASMEQAINDLLKDNKHANTCNHINVKEQ